MTRSSDSPSTIPPTTIRWHRDDDGVVTLVLDDPDSSTNTMNAAYVNSMGKTMDRLESEVADVTGVILQSAKRTFFAGGDLRFLVEATPETAGRYRDFVDTMKSQLRRLEKLGRPVVAVINGATLGGGMELALAAHHRIAIDSPDVVVGFPEVTLGILPGVGGVTRATRMVGVEAAVFGFLATGDRLDAAQAARAGLIDQLVPTAADLVPAARSWIRTHTSALAPWDRIGFDPPEIERIDDPGHRARLAERLAALPSDIHPAAPQVILDSALEGIRVDFDAASSIETQGFVDLVTEPVAPNLIRAGFLDLHDARRDAQALVGTPPGRESPDEAIAALRTLGVALSGPGIVGGNDQSGAGAIGVRLFPPFRGARIAEVTAPRALTAADRVLLPLVAHLCLRLGYVPVITTSALSETNGVAARIAEALRHAVRDLADAGHSRTDIESAWQDAGLRADPPASERIDGPTPVRTPVTDLGRHLLDAGALEATRCLDDGSISTEATMNLISIHGAGYPAWTGGAARWARSPIGTVADVS